MAGKIVRYEFLGSRFRLFLLCIFVITLPEAFRYLLECTVRVDEELENPSEFLAQHRASFGWGGSNNRT